MVALLLLSAQLSCATPTPSSPTVLLSTEDELVLDPGHREQLAPRGPHRLPYRGPAEGGSAYRIVLEISGEWSVINPGDPDDKPPLSESHLLELEYREFPTDGAGKDRDAYLLGLDALHYKLLQQNPPALREIELGSDRLRVRVDGKEAMDLRGAQPKEDLTPQKLLGRIFGVLVHDEFGNPLALAPRGPLVARNFLASLPIESVIRYSRLSLPQEEISPGARWHAARFPASRSGALGLAVDIEYSLVAYEELDGVPCALVLLRADEKGEDVASAPGFSFDRVLATMSGSAWIDLETSRVRRLILEDEVRVSLTRGKAPLFQKTRMRHATRMLLEVRDPTARPDTWADGSSRFGKR